MGAPFLNLLALEKDSDHAMNNPATRIRVAWLSALSLVYTFLLVLLPVLVARRGPDSFAYIALVISVVAPTILTLLLPSPRLGALTGAILVALACAAIATAVLAGDCPDGGTSAEPCVFSAVGPLFAATLVVPSLALRWAIAIGLARW